MRAYKADLFYYNINKFFTVISSSLSDEHHSKMIQLFPFTMQLCIIHVRCIHIQRTVQVPLY